MTLIEFLLAELPPAPARVLEVGCGDGAVARELATAGYDVVAVDPNAPDGPIFRRTRLEALDEPRPFDAAFAGRSLHHVDDLGIAVAKLADLIRPGGVLVLDEFAWERLDEQTADWYYGQLRALGAARGAHAPRSRNALMDEWNAEHAGLHTSDAMRTALASRFRERSFSWEPYFHRELGTLAAEGLERTLIQTGAILALGFRYVGERVEA